jgi:hypothetical protein
MSVIFIQVKSNKVTDNFFSEVAKKLKSTDILRNAFYGEVKKVAPGVFLVYMRPAYIFFNLPRWLLRFMMKRGLRKKGYKEDITFINIEEGLKRLFKWDK